ncbi:MAG TPA: sugar phosphate nucleotidyltransferase [Candidatus Deferrimicrobium sp.]|nr:sugar phosphate nucleotidyltransferase [Candidatus Deferrimicrobium sp.]
MEAVILAGGKGTRLHPYTTEIPKPLVTVGDKPIIEYLLRRMKASGVHKVYLAVNHLAHLLMAVMGDGQRFGIEIVYSREDAELSTVAPIKLISGLPENFLVVNGDVLTDLDFTALFDNHISSKVKVTVATTQRSTAIDYGVLETGPSGLVSGFREKPTFHFTVSMGVYVFSREVLRLVPDNQKFGFDDLMLTMLARGEPINTYPYDGYWLNVNHPDDYEQANHDIEKIKRLLL